MNKFKIIFRLRLEGTHRVFIIGNTPPLFWDAGKSMEMKKIQDSLYEVEIEFRSEAVIQYKYLTLSDEKSVEEKFFNGAYGAREVEIKDGLVIEDVWNKQIVPSKKRPCAFLWKSPIVAWDGKVTVCCTDDDFLFNLGNIKDISLNELWDGEKIQNFRLWHIKGEFNKMPGEKTKGLPFCLACHDWGNITLPDEKVVEYLKEIKREDLIEEYKKRVS